jgi:DNA-binding NarL/FixJ family response regulator
VRLLVELPAGMREGEVMGLLEAAGVTVLNCVRCQPFAPELTDGELRVLRTLLFCDTNQEIADNLSISDSTVKSHLRSLFKKLGVRTRTAALMKALAYGIPILEETCKR